MRKPRSRGSLVDSNRKKAWFERFHGYRKKVTTSRIESWLAQFTEGHRDIAARLLDCVTYVTHDEIEAAFHSALQRLPGWHAMVSRRRGSWRFVAFSRAAGESGDTMLHRFRSAAGLGAKKHDSLFINKSELLSADLGPDDTVVFVDDFAGTGNQVCTGWREVMSELLPGEPKTFLVLVATREEAKTRIERETRLRVRTSITLNEQDNLFSDTCIHFEPDEKSVLLRYCKRANRREPRGFGRCGLVFVLAHKAPNNSIPILHCEHSQWMGLFPRG